MAHGVTNGFLGETAMGKTMLRKCKRTSECVVCAALALVLSLGA